MKRNRMILKIILILLLLALLLYNFCIVNHDKMKILDNDFVSCIITNAIVVILFLITYYKIDSHNMKKEQNKREVAEMLLRRVMESAEKRMKHFLVYYKKFSNEGDSPLMHSDNFSKQEINDVFNLYLNNETEENSMYHEEICTMAKEGIISSDEYRLYLEIKEQLLILRQDDAIMRFHGIIILNNLPRDHSEMCKQIKDRIDKLKAKLDQRKNISA